MDDHSSDGGCGNRVGIDDGVKSAAKSPRVRAGFLLHVGSLKGSSLFAVMIHDRSQGSFYLLMSILMKRSILSSGVMLSLALALTMSAGTAFAQTSSNTGLTGSTDGSSQSTMTNGTTGTNSTSNSSSGTTTNSTTGNASVTRGTASAAPTNPALPNTGGVSNSATTNTNTTNTASGSSVGTTPSTSGVTTPRETGTANSSVTTTGASTTPGLPNTGAGDSAVTWFTLIAAAVAFIAGAVVVIRAPKVS